VSDAVVDAYDDCDAATTDCAEPWKRDLVKPYLARYVNGLITI
jgi:hypothetical protein